MVKPAKGNSQEPIHPIMVHGKVKYNGQPNFGILGQEDGRTHT
jgi:hypothetical protein